MTASKSYKVFVSTQHPGNAVDLLASRFATVRSSSPEPLNKSELERNLPGMDALVAVLEDKITEPLLKKFPQIKLVANVAVGYDNIDVTAASRCGVLVLNTPGVLDNATADLAFALLLASSRRLVEGDKFVRSGRWQNWRSDLLLGECLEGKTLGIIGLGRIGQAVASRAVAFGMNIVYAQRTRVSPEIEQRLGHARHVELGQLLQSADFISLHCPLNQSTHHLIGSSQFAMMKKSCILVNTARGPIVDERALVDALACGRIAGAGLDVFEREPLVAEELLSMSNVVLAPHIGSATVETRSKMVKLAVDGLVKAFAGEQPSNAVNPEVWPEFLRRLSEKMPVS